MGYPPRPPPSRRKALALLAAAAAPAAALAQQGRAQEVVVITSYPSSFYEPFRIAFERAQPELRLRIVNRKTTAAIALVADRRLADADIFWASAPDAFEVLKSRGLLLPLAERAAAPGAKVQGHAVDDPDGMFRGFTISGYGLSWNKPRLQALGLKPPVSVAELIDPAYRGLIAMSAPSRSGTTHLMVETILQRYGWQAGWGMWLQIAANLANIAARSFSVVSGVAQGRYAIGLSIDFIGRGGGAEPHVGFSYPSENVFLPASIALLRGGANREGAQRFARFVLSEAGQRLLLIPAIQRQPVMPSVAEGQTWLPLPLADWELPAHTFDAARSGRRYELVNVIFDELITERLVEIQRIWRTLHHLDSVAMPGTAEAAELAAIARLVSRPPDVVVALGRPDREVELRRIPRGSPVPAEQAALVQSLRAGVEQQLKDATARLNQLALRRMPGAAGALPGPGR